MLSIQDVATRLHVSRQTIYTYVSRGLLHAEPDPDNPKRSLYKVWDVERLAERQGRGRSHAKIAASTLSGGEPVLDSQLSSIKDGRLYYREHDAIALADTASLEDIAALLWSGDADIFTGAVCEPVPVSNQPTMQRIFRAMSALATCGPWTEHVEAAHSAAATLLTTMAATVGAEQHSAAPIYVRMGRGLSSHPDAPELVRRCLVLSADHELNPSTYAARVVASTRAPLGACVLGGLAALSGPRHGGMTNVVRTTMSDAALLAAPAAVVTARMERGERIPGFGQRLYPEGDPRAAAILAHVTLPDEWQVVVDTVERRTGLRPNIDFALAAVEHVLDMPHGAGFGLFATARTVGWIAHALEQWTRSQIIRPRAAYVRS